LSETRFVERPDFSFLLSFFRFSVLTDFPGLHDGH